MHTAVYVKMDAYDDLLLSSSVLRYSAFCVSRITINKLFDTILYHDTIMKWSWLVIPGILTNRCNNIQLSVP